MTSLLVFPQRDFRIKPDHNRKQARKRSLRSPIHRAILPTAPGPIGPKLRLCLNSLQEIPRTIRETEALTALVTNVAWPAPGSARTKFELGVVQDLAALASYVEQVGRAQVDGAAASRL